MNEPRRLHPLAMVLQFMKMIRQALIPLIGFVFAFSSDLGSYQWLLWLGFALLFFFLFILPSFLFWYRYKYWVEEGELKIEHGVFVKHHRYIRKERIQSINHSANVLHRLFGLEKVNIETAGGTQGSEAELSAVNRDVGQRLETILYRSEDDVTASEHQGDGNDQQEEVESDAAKEDARRSLPGGDLLIAGLTSGKIGVILVIVGAIFGQLNQVIPEDVYETVGRQLLTFGSALIVGLIVVAALLAWLASVLGTVLVYWRFTVKRTGTDLQTVSGLLERKQLTLPLHRIQAIRIVDGLFRQPFGFVTVYVESAGGSNEEQGGSSIVLFPLLRRKDLTGFLTDFVPDYPVNVDVTPVPRRALRRYLLRLLIPTAVGVAAVMTASALWFWPWGAWVLLLLPLVALIGYGQYYSAGWATTDAFRILRFRGLNRTTVIVPRRRIQTRTMSQSWFQRRGALATYHVSVMSKMAGVGAHFKVDHLQESDVYALVERR